MKLEVNCEFCNKLFFVRNQEIKRGSGKFCSHSCASKNYQSKRIIINNVFCSWCKKEFYKQPSEKKRSKSGLFFCCREHKDLAARLKGGIPEIQPSFYGTSTSNYRQIAFENYPIECNKCGYKKFIPALEVHHKDRNRNNCDLSNLEILCANCHIETHNGRSKRS